jgi:hypothetical protein
MNKRQIRPGVWLACILMVAAALFFCVTAKKSSLEISNTKTPEEVQPVLAATDSAQWMPVDESLFPPAPIKPPTWNEQLASVLDQLSSANSPEEKESLREQLKVLLQSLNPDNLQMAVDAYDRAGIFKGELYHEFFALTEAWSKFDTTGPIDFSLNQIGTTTADAVATSLLLKLNVDDAIGFLQRQPVSVQSAAAINWGRYLLYQQQSRAEDGEPVGEPVRLGSMGAVARLWFQAHPDDALAWFKQSYEQAGL